ncbi:predicted protein [Histoplasma capsulatum var. duboisii H88]|uniref:Predicted protein n=1 Tax=Ajellomyces capsulatus (strain H88) TaxID=544711 RepID=F0U7B6_AJEC8|nr:predicted protein [Histoplasma capsulatum var. duboisii H88]
MDVVDLEKGEEKLTDEKEKSKEKRKEEAVKEKWRRRRRRRESNATGFRGDCGGRATQPDSAGTVEGGNGIILCIWRRMFNGGGFSAVGAPARGHANACLG